MGRARRGADDALANPGVGAPGHRASPCTGPCPDVTGARHDVGGPWVLGIVLGSVTVIVLVLVVVLVSVGGPTFTPGTGTVTIHVKVPRSGRPSFTGTVAGRALTGTVTKSVSVSGAVRGSPSVDKVTFTYKGSLGSTPYVLHVSLTEDNESPQRITNETFSVTGTYGSERVDAVAGFEAPTSAFDPSHEVMISGTVGHQLVLGNATATQHGDGTVDVTARFTALANL